MRVAIALLDVDTARGVRLRDDDGQDAVRDVGGDAHRRSIGWANRNDRRELALAPFELLVAFGAAGLARRWPRTTTGLVLANRA